MFYAVSFPSVYNSLSYVRHMRDVFGFALHLPVLAGTVGGRRIGVATVTSVTTRTCHRTPTQVKKRTRHVSLLTSYILV